MRAIRRTIALWGCLVLGPLILVGGIYKVGETYLYERGAEKVRATVADVRLEHARRGADRLVLTVRFPTNGQSHQGEVRVSASKYEGRPPKEIDVLFDPADPGDVRLPGGATSMWTLPAVGVLMSLIGVYALRARRREKEGAAATGTAESDNAREAPA